MRIVQSTLQSSMMSKSVNSRDCQRSEPPGIFETTGGSRRSTPRFLEQSQNQRPFNVISLFRAVMFNAMVPVGAEMIESEAVGFVVDNLKESGLKSY